MDAQTFYIRSVAVQNLIMGVIAAIIIVLLIYFIKEQKTRHSIAVIVWALIVFWFFNSPMWGFSAVTVSPQGLKIHYGFFSVLKNSSLPPNTPWKIHLYMGGVRKMKKLYYFQLAAHTSLKVRGPKALDTMKSLGVSIDIVNGKPMGGMEDRPVNM